MRLLFDENLSYKLPHLLLISTLDRRMYGL